VLFSLYLSTGIKKQQDAGLLTDILINLTLLTPCLSPDTAPVYLKSMISRHASAIFVLRTTLAGGIINYIHTTGLTDVSAIRRLISSLLTDIRVFSQLSTASVFFGQRHGPVSPVTPSYTECGANVSVNYSRAANLVDNAPCLKAFSFVYNMVAGRSSQTPK
jgi:hypothetical protein